MKVGYFPYSPGGNPYQSLFASALESAGSEVVRIPPKKWFPLQMASRVDVEVLQFDWPHDWYRGKNIFSALIKRLMYEDGIKRLRNKPLVWTAHNLIAHDAVDIGFEKRMIQKLIDVTDGIIVLSALSEKKLRETYHIPHQTTVQIIHHGHYMDVYPNTIDRGEARKRMGIREDEKVILHLGRLLPYKGIEGLISAFDRVDIENSTLIIAGSCSSDSFRDKLTALATSVNRSGRSVKILPRFIADEELQVYFSAADVVALPFKNILNSGSLLLAMSFGKCVIAPDVGSIKEVACDAGWFKFSSSQPNALEEAIQVACHIEDLREREELVRQYTHERYSWDNVGKLATELYEKVSR